VEDYRTRVPVQVEVKIRGTARRLKAEIESVLFRIAQEALTNVAKHARASRVQVELDFGESLVSLSVTDDGMGFNPIHVLRPQARRKAWGLLGMQERADLVGGRCHIISRPGHGTCIHVEVPLGEEVMEHEEDQAAPGR
jgi:two-component system sensor histidine kinase UhpB